VIDSAILKVLEIFISLSLCEIRVLTAASMNIACRDIAPCNLAEVVRRFGGASPLKRRFTSTHGAMSLKAVISIFCYDGIHCFWPYFSLNCCDTILNVISLFVFQI
jgi:hypothetical protein